jgi:hypothetical protein
MAMSIEQTDGKYRHQSDAGRDGSRNGREGVKCRRGQM